MKIKDFFNNLKKVSLHTLKNTYYNAGNLVYIWYFLSLSSLSIKITNKKLILTIFEEMKRTKNKPESYVLKDKEETLLIESSFYLYFTKEYLEIVFTETKPVHFRKSYWCLIKSIIKNIPFFESITVNDINVNDSFFAILYSSFKTSKPNINNSSFVVYYRFTKEMIDNKVGNSNQKEGYLKQNVFGILPIKISIDFFLKRINFNNHMIYKPMPISPYGYFNLDTWQLRNMIGSINVNKK